MANVNNKIFKKMSTHCVSASAKMHGFVKWFKMKTFYCIATTFAIFVMFYMNNTSYLKRTKIEVFSGAMITSRPNGERTTEREAFYVTRPRTRTRYILLWTNPRNYPFVYFGEGNSIFKNKKCKYTNCYVTGNRQILRDVKEYDIIAFNGPQLITIMTNDDWPRERSVRQKYVYTNIEAASNYPLCSKAWNHYFNWTWTYKLDSDAIWGYIVIKNSSNHVIGPSTNIDWVVTDDMDPVDEDVKKKLSFKSEAAAWFVSNCNTVSKREDYVNRLSVYLNDYNLKVDIYGSCGTLQCPKPYMNRCLEEVQRKYYFYFAFENAISEDYVTEKILNAVNHYAVPVVFGGADYTR